MSGERDHALDWLKLFACGFMLVDHLRFVFPGCEWVAAPGRVAFPLFAWCLACNFHRTRDKGRYMIRLAVAALVSEIPYFLLMGRAGNILFLLLCAVAVVGCKSWGRWAGVVCAPFFTYGVSGVASVVLLLVVRTPGAAAVAGLSMNPLPLGWISAAVLAWVARGLPACRPAPSCVRWVLWFYPAHLLILVGVRVLTS